MDGHRFTVEDVYRDAIADSSNEAYDTLVRIVGVDWINTRFLTAANGFPSTVIQRSYTGEGVRSSPKDGDTCPSLVAVAAATLEFLNSLG